MSKTLRVDGVDISHHQDKDIQWRKAKKDGVKFVYHKATEGVSLTDGNYNRRRAEARNHSVPFGAYHFARPDGGDAEQEAQNFLQHARPEVGDLLPVLDLETNDGGLTQRQLTQWAWRFCEAVRTHCGVRPMLYTPFDLNRHFGTRLWVARYSNSNQSPRVPKPWDDWDVWQFSEGIHGSPKRVDGFNFPTDLNHLRRGVSVEDLLIPAPRPDDAAFWVAHISMQFSDSDREMKQDVGRLFARAKEKGWWWFTGTEAGGKKAKPLPALLKEAAEENGYRFHKGSSVWVCVRKDIIESGSWTIGYEAVLKPSEGNTGPHTGRGVAWANFTNDLIGEVTVGCGHYLTNGRNPGDPNYQLNLRMAETIGDWATIMGRGKALVFYHGDQNISDRNNDTFFDQPLTSAWDALEKWMNTGHGNIDVIAQYDKDGRVQFTKVRALNDRKFPLHTDHFLVEARVNVQTI